MNIIPQSEHSIFIDDLYSDIHSIMLNPFDWIEITSEAIQSYERLGQSSIFKVGQLVQIKHLEILDQQGYARVEGGRISGLFKTRLLKKVTSGILI